MTQNDEHPVERKKSRWWSPRRKATRIFAALVAVGTLLVMFRGYYIHFLLDSPLTVLRAATVVAAVVVLIRIGQHYEWTGFGKLVQPKPDNKDIQPRKTLWDWLQLLVVPVALAGIGYFFTMQQDIRQQDIENERARQAQKIEDHRAAAERELTEKRAQYAALQAYLDQMGTLLLNRNLRAADQDSNVRNVARARTLTTLAVLDPYRKQKVLRFLNETKLIQRSSPDGQPVISLRYAEMQGVKLGHIGQLGGFDLKGIVAVNADLSNAHMLNADVHGADLREADLSEAVLTKADLLGSKLIGAKLTNTDLTNTDLTNTDLTDAQVTDEQLDAAKSLEGATMPDGKTLRSDKMPNGPTFEDWLKDKKAQGKDEKNE